MMICQNLCYGFFTYIYQIIQLLLPEEAAIICWKNDKVGVSDILWLNFKERWSDRRNKTLSLSLPLSLNQRILQLSLSYKKRKRTLKQSIVTDL